MGITKEELKNLPKCPMDNETQQNTVEYVNMVMDGSSRAKALESAFPSRYERALSRASGNKNVVDANVKKEYNQIERSKYAQGLFVAAEKHWWMKFMTRKQKIYGKLYEIAMDDEQDTKDQIASSKALLQYLPSAPSENKLEVTHKVQSTDFKDMLLAKKKELHNAANAEAIDVEVTSE